MPACSPSVVTYYAIPDDYRIIKNRESVVNKYSHYLKGRIIFIDPGHGGDDRKNVGSLGLAVEADVNLRVGLALRDLLKKAGATVVMSREKDESIDIYERTELANFSKADIFISIHHNATGYPYDRSLNYTATFYHADESSYNFEPCNKDIARYIQRDLAFAMGNSGGPDSFDGTYPDKYIIPEMGIAVLRDAKIPAVLLECGFHSSPFEEKRLIEPEFNQLQAWGIFKGLGRYFEAGVPEIKFISKTVNDSPGSELIYQLKDRTGIDPSSIRVYLNSKPIEYNYDPASGQISLIAPEKTAAENVIRIICANIKGNHSFPFYDKQ
ncbi:MAG TPA: N-acetylmuramoyl-L-alanine amidase [Ignavibacteriales bacterium]|nr:N-acetylmuramoyl-L-alanine amidase [Ignavibacteriales bacterium]